MSDIHRIYDGLPEYYRDKVYWVEEQFRTNPLSREPGGSVVVVEYHAAQYYENNWVKILGYDRIKFPSDFISKVIRNECQNFEDCEEVYRMETAKGLFAYIFARRQRGQSFELVLDFRNSAELPSDVIERFDMPRRRQFR